jgi:hypothetical protein
MSFEDFERGYLLPGGCKDLSDVIELQGHPETKLFLKPEKPLFMTVCSNCEAKCFVPVPNPDSNKPTETNETAHPAKCKLPFVCPRCGHKQFAEH